MSPAFISGIEKTFDNAEITFDKFRVVKVLNAAVDEVRRQEQKERPELKKTRWVWLKNEKNQKDKDYEIFESLKNMNWRTVRATHLKINFQELYSQPKEVAEKFLKKWYFWATHCRIQPMIDAAKARARGFRSMKNFITMVYIIAGKLDFRLPT
jgi:transposase